MSLGKLQPLAVAVLVTKCITCHRRSYRFRPLVVTAPNMEQPLTVTTDPKAPRQPIPAHDGADLLKKHSWLFRDS